MFRYLPEQASEVAPKVDWINNVITDISVFFTVAIVGSMLYFAIRYRKKGGVDHETPRIEGNHFLEFLWTAVPTVICVFVAAWGMIIFDELRAVPRDALSINVLGRQWAWAFQYETGKKTAREVVIPVNKPVKFVLGSEDVLHSFYIPAMRVKSDAVPGQYTYVSFKPVKTGTYDIFCAEYCGKDHSAMLAKLKVVPEEEYERWLHDESDKIKHTPADMGRAIYTEQGCNSCHSLDGSKVVGPSFLKLYGRKGKFTTGEEYTADENYIKESILVPTAHVVEGFPDPSPMPSFQSKLDDDQINAMISFIKSLDGSSPAQSTSGFNFAKQGSGPQTPAARGKLHYETKACKGCHSLDGSKVVGPSFKGLFGRTEKMADGSSVSVDEAYLKESILDPGKKIVEGFQAGQMPATFSTMLSEQDIADIIEFIKSVK